MGDQRAGDRSPHGCDSISRHRTLVHRVAQADHARLSTVRHPARGPTDQVTTQEFLPGVGENPGRAESQAPGINSAQGSCFHCRKAAAQGPDELHQDAVEVQQGLQPGAPIRRALAAGQIPDAPPEDAYDRASRQLTAVYPSAQQAGSQARVGTYTWGRQLEEESPVLGLSALSALHWALNCGVRFPTKASMPSRPSRVRAIWQIQSVSRAICISSLLATLSSSKRLTPPKASVGPAASCSANARA